MFSEKQRQVMIGEWVFEQEKEFKAKGNKIVNWSQRKLEGITCDTHTWASVSAAIQLPFLLD
jgi:hypothetical protein